MKELEDSNSYVKPSELQVGDSVYVKRDDSKNRGDTPYHPDSKVIIEKKGSMVQTRDGEGVEVTRNLSFFKSAPDRSHNNQENDREYTETPAVNPEAEKVAVPERRYFQRERYRPMRLKECV